MESLKARLQNALDDVYDVSKIEAGAPRPGQSRQHVFDTEQGVRMIVSVDKPAVDEPPVLHISFSLIDPLPPGMTLEKFGDLIDSLPSVLFGRTMQSTQETRSSMVVHHLYPWP